MTTRIQKIRLGLFMMVSSLFAAGFIIYIVGQTLMEDWDNYYIRFTETSVSGLQIGSAVKYHGITLGSVEDISIDPEDVASIIIKITIKKGTAVKSDVRATLSPIGITGMLLIELQGGTNTASNLENEGFIKRGSSTFETITGQAEKLSEKMELLLGNAIALTGNQNRYKFENILLNLDEMSGDQNKDLISEFLQNINNLTSESTKSKLDQFLEDLNKLSREENQEKVELILDNLNILLDENSNHISLFIEDMSRFSSNLITVSDQFSIFVGKLDKQAEKTGFQMDTLMTNLNILSKQLVDADIPVLVHNVNDAVTIIKTTTDHVDLTVMNGRQDLLVLLATLRDATENLNEFSRQISNDPSLLLRQKK